MTANHLLIRADASRDMGWGHFMRCLAVAQAWRDGGGTVAFVSAPLETGLRRRLESDAIECIEMSAAPGSVEDAAAAKEAIRAKNASVCLVDGYHFSADYRAALGGTKAKLACFDDNGETKGRGMNLLINYNAHAAASLYVERDENVRFLIGTSYAPLRREFRLRPSPPKQIAETIETVLIILGGTDPENRTGIVLRALSRSHLLDHGKVILVSGTPPSEELLRSIREMRHPVAMEIQPGNLVELMEQADLAISAGGFSLYELMSLSVPTAALCVAGNQKGSVTALANEGAILNLGSELIFDPDEIASRLVDGAREPHQRELLARTARARSDGQGAPRIVEALQTFL